MVSRVIEAKLLLTGEDRASKVFAQVEKAVRQSGKAMAEMEKVNKASAEVEKLTKAYDRAAKAAKEVEVYRKARAAVASTEAAYKMAASRAGEYARQLDTARKAEKAFADGKNVKAAAEMAAKVRDLTNQHRDAERQMKGVNAAVRAQSQAFEAARAAVRGYGVPITDLDRHEKALKQSIDATTGAIKRQRQEERLAAEARARHVVTEAARLQRSAVRREAIGAAGSVVGVAAAHRGKEVARDAISAIKEFDDAVLRQRAYADVKGPDQDRLISQAKRIGQETQFSNVDVVRSQTTAMQGLPGFSAKVKAEVAEGIVDNVRNYATMMETDLKEGAETIRSYLTTTGKDISSKEKALDEARKATNQLVKMAKLGGMSGDDVSQFVKYSASSGTVAGLSSETLMTLGALGRRSGLRGDEMGVFVRSAASKLVAPTKKGRDALNASGIDYDSFVRMPERLDTGALERQFQTEVGKGFTPDVRARVEAVNVDKTLIADREKYVQAITSAVSPILGKRKDGEVSAQQSQIAAKATGNYYKYASQSVDTEGLLREILGGKMTLGQLNAFFTDKHGGKGALTQNQYSEFKAVFDELKATGDDPDFAKKKSDLIMSGVAGSLENLKGSYENFTQEIGKANEGLIKFTADGLGKALDSFSKLDVTTQQVLSLGGAATAAGAGITGFVKLAGGLFGSGALTASAGELTIAAKALDAAAVRLGAGGAATAAGSTAAGVATGSALAVGGVVAGVAAGGAVASHMANEAVRQDPNAYSGNIFDSTYSSAAGIYGAEADPTKALADAFRGQQQTVDDMRKQAQGIRDEIAALRAKAGSSMAGPRSRIGTDARIGDLEGQLREIERVIGVRLKTSGTESGAAAGAAAGQAMAEGVKDKVSAVEAEAKALMQSIEQVFATGVKIPISLAPGAGGFSGGGGLINASYGGGGGLAGSVGAGASAAAVNPDHWSHRPSKANHMQGQYGAAGTNLTSIKLDSGKRVTVHSAAADGFKGFLSELEGTGYKIDSIGGFNLRKKVGGRGLSQHAYGNAIDINPAKNPYSKKFITDLPKNVSEMAAKHGLSWGGDWKSVKDTMHFEWTGKRPGKKDDAGVQPQSLRGLGPGSAPLEMQRAADRMNEAAAKFERLRLNTLHTVELTGSGRDGARVRGMRSQSEGPIQADVGLSMPHINTTRVG